MSMLNAMCFIMQTCQYWLSESKQDSSVMAMLAWQYAKELYDSLWPKDAGANAPEVHVDGHVCQGLISCIRHTCNL